MARYEQLADLTDEFKRLSLFDFLSLDPRPTFVIDLQSSTSQSYDERNLAFVNDACQESDLCNSHLLTLYLSGSSPTSLDAETIAWLYWVRHAHVGGSYRHGSTTWELTILHDRWQLFTGTIAKERVVASSMPARSVFDLALESGCISPEYHRLLESVDWAKTSFGACSTWPLEIRSAVSLTLANPSPCNVVVGTDRVMLYNQAYPALIKKLHPAALGTSAKATFYPFWEQFEVLMLEAERTGHTVTQKDNAVHLYRSDDSLEEAYFSYAYAPIRDSDGRFLGIYNEVMETTGEILSRRRMATLLKIGEATSAIITLDQFWRVVLQAFDLDISEIPLGAIYTRGRDIDVLDLSDDDPTPEDDLLKLKGSVGLKGGSATFPMEIDLSSSSKLARAINRSITMTDPLLLATNTLLSMDISEIEDKVLTSEIPRVVICPLQESSLHNAIFVILGIKDFRPYDNDYKTFVNLLTRQIAIGAASVALFAQEKRILEQSAEQAELERERMSKELEIKRREAAESAWRFLEFAKHAPVGVFIHGPKGETIFANDTWYRLMGVPHKLRGSEIWRDYIHPEDLVLVDGMWEQITKHGKSHADFEFRVRSNPVTGSFDGQNCGYLTSSCFTEVDQNGRLKAVTGVVIDNTIRKAHERETAQTLARVLEAKRTQENFMDMVSHEMRNPLNAMIQCADEVFQLLTRATSDNTGSMTPQAVQDALESVNTIVYCGHHQKKIIDDVLTISKLDSNLLTLAPTLTEPVSVLHHVLQIYNSEIRASNIIVSVSSKQAAVNKRIMFDSSRVLQILMNLVGNAVKFLKDSPTRKLDVSVSVTTKRPSPTDLVLISSALGLAKPETITSGQDHQVHYIYYSVDDTGPGLTQDEMATLFGRFKQASPRTHAQYGGSGLGLFISRKLTELHGGEIGLASTPGKGSTFAFYVQGYAPSTTTSSTFASTDSTSSSYAKLNSPGDLIVPSFSSRADASDTLAPDLQSYTVMIVEDNIINQNVLSRQLRRAGFGVITADNGKEALSRLCEPNHIHLVLCDLEMPVMDGLTYIHNVCELRERRELIYIPMVAVTGNARPEQVQTAKDAGFDSVICKPYSIVELVSLIKDLLKIPLTESRDVRTEN